MNKTVIAPISDPPRVPAEQDAAGVLRLLLRFGPMRVEEIAERAGYIGVSTHELDEAFHVAGAVMQMDAERRWWWLLPGHYGDRLEAEIGEWLETPDGRLEAVAAEWHRTGPAEHEQLRLTEERS